MKSLKKQIKDCARVATKTPVSAYQMTPIAILNSMATNQSSFTLSKTERRFIVGRAKELGLSFSNYVRLMLGLEPMKVGGSEAAKRGSKAYQARKKAAVTNGGTK